MKFDELNVKPCALASMTPPGCATGDTPATGGGTEPTAGCEDADYRVAHPGECPDEPECADPAYAEAHPELCLGTTRLVIKPAVAAVEAMTSVQFRAYLWKNGVEQEVTGARFAVTTTGIAVIGLTSGNATGVTPGITTVSATYAGMTAHAQLEVTANCSSRANYFALIFDVSKSTTAQMGGNYSTRLAAAKSIGQGFVQCLRDKDWVGVWKFDSGASQLAGFNFDKVTTKQVIGSISSSNATQTDLSSGLDAATAAFNMAGVGASNRIYVLFTDGENKQGTNPVALAQSIRSTGAVVIIVGLRSYGTWFKQLELMANGGFFLNATPQNVATIGDILNGLKGYFCSGKCVDEGGYNGPTPALNYTDFAKWTVTQGTVDLIGRGAYALFDVQPEHGLYVDLCGSGGTSGDLGTIETTEGIPFVAGHSMTLKFKLAGNQREARAADVVRVAVRRQSDDLIVAWRDYSLASTDAFAEHSYTWPALTGDHVIMVSQRTVGGPTTVFGCLLDDVVLTDDTDGTVLFEDSFDNENITRIPKACGTDTVSDPSVNVDCSTFAGTCTQDEDGTWHFTGYDCDTGCGCAVDTTGAQLPDPSPVSDLEGGAIITPTVFTSTRSFTGTCALGYTGDPVTRSAIATSEISQADADARALAAATALVNAELVCVAPFDVGDILNLRFWPNAPISGVSARQVAADRKTGFGVFGQSHDDFWNQPGAELVNDLVLSSNHVPLYKHTGERTDIRCVHLSSEAVESYLRLDHPDPIMRWSVVYPSTGNTIYKIDNLPNGTYAVAVYGRSNDNDGGGLFELSNGSDTYTGIFLDDSDAWRDAHLIIQVHAAYWKPVTVNEGYLTVSALQNTLGQVLLGAIQLTRIT